MDSKSVNVPANLKKTKFRTVGFRPNDSSVIYWSNADFVTTNYL